MDKTDNQRRNGPMSALAIFLKTCVVEYGKKHPSFFSDAAAVADFQARCTVQWNQLNDKEKNKYKLMVEKDQKNYESESEPERTPIKKEKEIEQMIVQPMQPRIAKRRRVSEMDTESNSEDTGNEDAGSEEEDEEREGVETFSKHLKNLFINSKNTADVVFKFKDQEIQAHRLILAARSPVFDSMFQHNMREKDTAIIPITECVHNVFYAFLLYLYTGKFQPISVTDAVLLYKTADKYQVLSLKKACIRCMKKKLTVESFCEVAAVADMHKETGLLESVNEFFSSHAKLILPSESWKKFIAEQSVLANDIIIKYVDNVENEQ